MQKGFLFKNSGPFRSCISVINNLFIVNAEDLNIVMSMYNLLESSENSTLKVCGIIIAMKWLMLMTMFNMVNYLNIRQK